MTMQDKDIDYIHRLIACVRQQIANDPDTINACNDCCDSVLISRWADASILCDVVEDLLLDKMENKHVDE